MEQIFPPPPPHDYDVLDLFYYPLEVSDFRGRDTWLMDLHLEFDMDEFLLLLLLFFVKKDEEQT
jgi:hypothetical protein